jgi:NADPH:quinone reductase-like Zn-dependent oxidoreductase
VADGNKDTMTSPPTTGLQLQSLISASGTLELSLVAMAIDQPTPDEVVVQIEAASVNPADLGLPLGPAHLSTVETRGDGASRRTTIRVPEERIHAMAARFNKAMPVGQ